MPPTPDPVTIPGRMVEFSLKTVLGWAFLIGAVSGCSVKKLDLIEEKTNRVETDGSASSASTTTNEKDAGGISDVLTSSGPSSSPTSQDGRTGETNSSDVSLESTNEPSGPSYGCPTHRPYYLVDYLGGRCVECLWQANPADSDHCQVGFACEPGRYECLPYCSSDRDCLTREENPLPVCDRERRACRGCGNDFECDEGLYCLFPRCVPAPQ